MIRSLKLFIISTSLLGAAALAQAADPTTPPATPAPAPATTATTQSAAPTNRPGSKLISDTDRMSYAVGIAYGRSLLQQRAKLDIDKVIEGFRDSYNKHVLELSEAEYRALYRQFQQSMIAMMGKAREFAALDNQEAGRKFLTDNAKKQGVVSLEDGLQYKVITMGTGEKPTMADTVTVNYRGTLINDIEIDNTWRRNQPATFEMRKAISGWREALQMMPVGSKWQLFVPPELAYSKQGTGRIIGPNATLIFEIELLSVKKS